MILINKEESMEIRKRFKDVAIYTTMRQAGSKRHKRYTEERPDVLAFLKQFRERNVVEHLE